MEIRFTLEEPLKSKVLERMLKAGKTSARAEVIEILEEALLPPEKKASPAKSKAK